MKTKYLLCLVILLAFGGSLFAQTPIPIVAGVVTADVGRNSNFKIIVNQTITSVVLSSSSTPTAGQYVTLFFAENATGGFAVTFGGNISNPCTVSTTANATTNCSFQYDATSNTWFGAGGGSSSGSGVPKGSVDATASPYNAKFDVHWGTQYTITNTSNVISNCTDCHFLGTDILGRPNAIVGQLAWASTETIDITAATSTLTTPECVIQSIDSDTGIHLGTVGAIATPCNATSSTAGHFWWGDCDSALTSLVQSTSNDPLFNAWSAANAQCAQLVLPVGAGFIEQAEFVTSDTTKVCNATNSIQSERFGYSIRGQGRGSTFLIPTPNFKFSTCTGPNGTGATCLFAFQNEFVSDLQVHGGGNSACGGAANGKNLAGVLGNTTNGGSNTLWKNVMLFGWCANTSGTIGLNIGLIGGQNISGGEFDDVWVENFGCNTVTSNPGSANTIQWHLGDFWGGAGCNHTLIISSGAFKSSLGFHCGNPLVGGFYCVQVNGGTWYTTDDFLQGQGGNTAFIANGAALHSKGSIFALSGTANTAIYCNTGATCTVYAQDTRATGTSVRPFYSDTSAALSVFDGGNNSFPGGQANGPGTVTWNGAGNGDTFSAGCSGVATPSQTLGLYGTGSNVTLTTCTSTTIGAGVVMKNSGTLVNLFVSATAAGTNASSGVVTVLKNGSATGAPTCTIGTGTACNDGTHALAYVRGDLISIQFTTQAADTLAGVKATVVAN